MDTAAGRASVSSERSGRKITATANMALAYQWLDECLHEHGELCSKSDSQATSSSRPNRLRVIDVRERHLLDLPTGAEYIALSYCWPKDPGLTNTLAQSSSLYKAGAITLENDLSDAIDDACNATCDLGQQYLWVDALCIIQDSPADKADQIDQMDLVYNAALMTIVIAPENNETDQASLPGYRTASSSRRQIIHTVGHLSFAVPKPCLEDILAHTRWETRGWTYQESHLSRRSLYFTSHQLYFQCSCGIRSEDTSGEGHPPSAFIHHSTTLWNPKNKHAADPESDFGDLILSHSGYENDAEELRAYNNFATFYTQRSLSFASDTLNAFRGIEKVLGASLKTEFYAGLPLKYLDCVLLWQSSDAAGRRQGFPSFAWAGWMGLHECPYWLGPEETGRLVRWWRVVRGTYLPCETATTAYTAEGEEGGEEQTGVMQAQVDVLPSPPLERSWGLATITQVARFDLWLDRPAEVSDADTYQSGQHHWMLDAQQRKAGLILIDNDWRQRSQTISHGKQQHDFILLSRASKARVQDEDEGELPNE
ncbi:hypothetical protein N0V83_008957 [Neocucurbitaria cava]|uniref:Heterokaryon incompatibility domain-containing protein n=1 Tax=Neocucurbitaria cava TaxID=798079 RepID=A0A9W8Y1P2_9PLEO|nr:hypothetical protein N0V83_008957 [Neocucurbitaria cava]